MGSSLDDFLQKTKEYDQQQGGQSGGFALDSFLQSAQKDDAEEEPKKSEGILSDITTGFKAGVGQMMSDTTKAIQALGKPAYKTDEEWKAQQTPLSKSVIESGDNLQKDNERRYDPYSKEWWAYNIANTTPNMIGLAGASAAAMRTGNPRMISAATENLATRVGLGAKAAAAAGELGAAGTVGVAQTFPEAALEGQNAYEDAIKEGRSPDEAEQIRKTVTNANMMLLSGSNTAEIAAAFGKLPFKLPGGVVGRLASRGIALAVPEGIEEGAQQIIQKDAAGKEWHVNDPDVVESAALGAGAGLIFGGGAHVANKLLNTMANRGKDGNSSDGSSLDDFLHNAGQETAQEAAQQSTRQEAAPSSHVDDISQAIMGQESGGNYNVVNSDSGAFGAFQIMPENLPSWAEEAGIPLDQAKTPEGQTAVAKFKFNQYLQQFGSPELVAAAWYAGPGYAQSLKDGKPLYDPNTRFDAEGNLDANGQYPSVAEYMAQVTARMKGSSAGSSSSSSPGAAAMPKVDMEAVKKGQETSLNQVNEFLSGGVSKEHQDVIRNFAQEKRDTSTDANEINSIDEMLAKGKAGIPEIAKAYPEEVAKQLGIAQETSAADVQNTSAKELTGQESHAFNANGYMQNPAIREEELQQERQRRIDAEKKLAEMSGQSQGIILPTKNIAAGMSALQELKQKYATPIETLPTADEANLKRSLKRAYQRQDYATAANIASQLGDERRASLFSNIVRQNTPREQISLGALKEQVQYNKLNDMEKLHVDNLLHHNAPFDMVEAELEQQRDKMVSDYTAWLRGHAEELKSEKQTIFDDQGNPVSSRYVKRNDPFHAMAVSHGYTSWSKVPKSLKEELIKEEALRQLRNGSYILKTSPEVSEHFNQLEVALREFNSLRTSISNAIPAELRQSESGSTRRAEDIRSAAEQARIIANAERQEVIYPTETKSAENAPVYQEKPTANREVKEDSNNLHSEAPSEAKEDFNPTTQEQKESNLQQKPAKEEKQVTPSEESKIFDPSRKESIKEKLLAKRKPAKLLDVIDDSDENLQKAIDDFKREASKISANPVFNPKLLDAALRIGMIHLQRGVNSFADWAVKCTDTAGESIKPYLPGTWDMIHAWPEGEKYDGETANLLFEYAGIEYENGHDTEEKLSKQIASELGSDFIPFAKTAYVGVSKFMDVLKGGGKHDQSTGKPMERNSQETEPSKSVGQEILSHGSDGTGGGHESRSGSPGEEGSRSESITGVHDDSAHDSGAERDSRNGQENADDTKRTSGSEQSARSSNNSFEGVHADETATSGVDAAATDGADVAVKIKKQKKAVSKTVKVADLDNIRETLPFLMPEQQEDVYFIEQRHSKPDGYGVLITNGTGTGKTYTGLGAIKRMVMQGKDNIIVTVPNDEIAADWISSGKNLGLSITQLENTKSSGRGVVVTTYANFGQNPTLVNREWDMILTDESHYLSSNEKGAGTGALDTLRKITFHPSGLWGRFQDVEHKLVDSVRRAADALSAARESDDPNVKASIPTLESQLSDLRKKEDAKRSEWMEKWQAIEPEEKPRVLFLSATPFPYVKNVDYAEGFLFHYGDKDGHGYNDTNGYEQFFVEHFGYRMRYNKLTSPDAEVDNSIMEQGFHQWLRDQGVLSGRMLTVDKDYDRKFCLVDDAIGAKIDDGLNWLSEADGGRYRPLYDAVMENFDYLKRMYLLESIKAKHVVGMIQEHLDLGRKVVVFHDYNKGGGFHPFLLDEGMLQSMALANQANGKSSEVSLKDLYREFKAKRKDLLTLDLSELLSPVAQMKESFGDDALFFNGTVPKKKRLSNVDEFNDDNSGKNLIVVQSDAGREGISLHDRTGKHQRVLIHLGMPIKPTASIQIEGRIYRVGQASDAIFRYLNTGTGFEQYTFAHKIAERASTAENLALGADARALKESFVSAFEESDTYPAGDPSEGKGGKEKDRSAKVSMTDFERAKSYYYGQQKKTSKNKAREGVDYYATPEPIGCKMVEWAGIRDGERALEPSAGHGAIARFFPKQGDHVMIEPSYELGPKAMMVSPAKLVSDTFENYHIVNKFDAIVMNPPYGHGGKTAMEHVSKAVQHLNNGGRVVALIPDGGMMDKRFNEWYESDKAKNIHLVGEVKLPGVTFNRAGTSVNTRVVILEKQTDPDLAAQVRSRSPIDLSRVENINELFDRMESISMPERSKAQDKVELQPEESTNFAPSSDYELHEFKHTKTGETIYIAKPKEQLDNYNDIVSVAKKNKGWYNRFAGDGAKRGFAFKSAEDRDGFLSEVAGQEDLPVAKEQASSYNVRNELLKNHPEYADNKEALSLAERGIENTLAFSEGATIETAGTLFRDGTDGRTPDMRRGNRTTGNHSNGQEREVENSPVRNQRRVGKTVGLAVTRDLIKGNPVSLVGHTVSNPEELAIAAQILRHPGYETIHIVYTKDNNVVHHEAYSSRLPDQSSFFKPGENKLFQFLNRLHSTIERTGADGYYFVHNHPSGVPNPSKMDVMQTKSIANVIDNKGNNNNPINVLFKGHIVINSTQYAVINRNGDIEMKDLHRNDGDKLLSPEINHPSLGINVGIDNLATIAKSVQVSSEYSTVFYVTAKLEVRGVQEVPNEIFNNLKTATRYLRWSTRAHYSYMPIVVTNSHEVYAAAEELIEKGIVIDAAHVQYEETARESGVEPLEHGDKEWMGIKRPIHGERVMEKAATYAELNEAAVAGFPDEALESPFVQRWAKNFWRDLGTKSPFFRRWFGDWRTKDQTPVSVAKVLGNEIIADGVKGQKESKKAAEAYLKSHPELKEDVVNKDTGWTFDVSKDGFYETLYHASSWGNTETFKIFPAIREIMENGVLVSSETNRYKPNKNNPWVHVFYSPVQIGEKMAYVKTTIKEIRPTEGGAFKKFYHLEMVEVEDSGVKPASTITVADVVKHVKDEHKSLTDSSRVVDENGHPKVMYISGDVPTKSSDGKIWAYESKDAAGDNPHAVYISGKNEVKEGKVSVISLSQIKSVDNQGTFNKSNSTILASGFDPTSLWNDENVSSAAKSVADATKKLARKLGVRAADNVEIRDNDTQDRPGFLSRYFASANKIAKDHPKMMPFFRLATRATEKQEELRNHFRHRKEKWEKVLGSKSMIPNSMNSEFAKNKEELYGLLWQGDLDGTEYTSQELKDQGYSVPVIKAYRMARVAMDHAYNLMNEVRQGVETYSKNMSRAELQELRENKFATILREEGTADGNTLVSWKAPKITERVVTMTGTELEELRNDPNAQILQIKDAGGLVHIRPESSGVIRGDGFYEVEYRSQVPPISKRGGYIPHFFHDWFVMEKVVDRETGEVAYKMFDSGKTMREATEKANAAAEENPDKEYLIQPKQFQFPGASMQAAVVGDFEYFKMMQKVSDDLSISLADANKFMGDKVHMKSRRRYMGNFQQRKGADGFDTNLDWVLTHYFNMASRYVALDPFKSKSISLFERLFGRWDNANHTGMASYVKDYVNDVNGVPTDIENAINDALKLNPYYRKFLGQYFGDRPALQLATAITDAVAVAKLGMLNLSSAIINTSQFINIGSVMNDYGAAADGLKRSISPSMSDKTILHRAGVDSGITLDNAGGYSKAGQVKNWFKNTTITFRALDVLMRRAAILGAYHKAISEGKGRTEALEYARHVNRKANFDYGTSDAPNIFRRGGPLSQVFLQFKKYGIKQFELMSDIVKDGDAKQNMRLWVPTLLLSGMWGIPFIGVLFNVAKGLFDDDWEEELKKAAYEWAGGDKIKQNLVKAALYGGLATEYTGQIDISKRTGIGDMVPGSLRDLFGPFVGTLVSAGREASRGNINEMAKAISPGVGNILVAAAGETKGQRGRTNTRYEDMYDRIVKGMSFLPIDETVERDKTNIIKSEDRSRRDLESDAITDYVKNPSQKNIDRLRELGITGRRVKEEMRRGQKTALERAEDAVPKKSAREYLGIREFD